MDNSSRFRIAKITSAHGIKGFVKMKFFIDDLSILENAPPLFIGETSNDTFILTLKNAVKTQWVVQIAGVTDRNRAEELRGTELFIENSTLPSAPEGSFSQQDLIGMTILDSTHTPFGEIIAVQNFGAGDLLEINPLTGSTFYFPFNEDTCPVIDIQNKTIETKGLKDFIF